MSNSINADWHRDHVLGSNAPNGRPHCVASGARAGLRLQANPGVGAGAIAEQEPKNGGSGGSEPTESFIAAGTRPWVSLLANTKMEHSAISSVRLLVII